MIRLWVLSKRLRKRIPSTILFSERLAEVHQPPHPPGSSTYPVVPQAWGLEKPTVTPEYKSTKWIALLSVPNNSIIPSRLAETTNKNNGKECWEFVNDVAWAWLMWNYAADKLRVANESTGKTWSVVVWNPAPGNKYFEQFLHTGIIVWDFGDMWAVKSSNLWADGRVTTNYVPKSVIMWYKSTNLV